MSGAIHIALSPVVARRSELFEAIPERRTTRSEYDGSALSAGELRKLEAAAAFPGVGIELLTDRLRLQSLVEYVTQANSAQIADAAFVAELRAGIRFSKAEALATGDGPFVGATGSPTMPRWLASPLFGMFFTAEAENEKTVKQLCSSAGAVVFVGEGEHRSIGSTWAAHINISRCSRRFWACATRFSINRPRFRPFAANSPTGGVLTARVLPRRAVRAWAAAAAITAAFSGFAGWLSRRFGT